MSYRSYLILSSHISTSTTSPDIHSHQHAYRMAKHTPQSRLLQLPPLSAILRHGLHALPHCLHWCRHMQSLHWPNFWFLCLHRPPAVSVSTWSPPQRLSQFSSLPRLPSSLAACGLTKASQNDLSVCTQGSILHTTAANSNDGTMASLPGHHSSLF